MRNTNLHALNRISKREVTMMVQINYVSRPPLPKILTYIAFCCREWVAPFGYPGGKCGLCGERPTYLRPDDECQNATENAGIVTRP